jgi:prepilin-type N-terminal cleavage/methylation domain-containing protein
VENRKIGSPEYSNRRGGCKWAFTLLELLVVISIIAILSSMLAPALFKATEKGKRVTCQSNLHQFGIAVNLYAADNSHHLLKSVQRPVGNARGAVQYVYPGGAWTTNNLFPGQYNVGQMAQYMPGFTMNAATRSVEIASVWWCPSANDPNMRSSHKAGLLQGYFESSYSYFSGASGWPRQMANKPTELTDDELRSDRLLMNDTLFYRTQNRAWSYNHGIHGAADNSPNNRVSPKDFGPPAVTGMNQLYGDGHAAWKNVDTNSAFRGGSTGLGGIRGYLQDTTFH